MDEARLLQRILDLQAVGGWLAGMAQQQLAKQDYSEVDPAYEPMRRALRNWNTVINVRLVPEDDDPDDLPIPKGEPCSSD